MQATFGKHVLYTEKFSLYFLRKRDVASAVPYFFIAILSGAARQSRNVKA